MAAQTTNTVTAGGNTASGNTIQINGQVTCGSLNFSTGEVSNRTYEVDGKLYNEFMKGLRYGMTDPGADLSAIQDKETLLDNCWPGIGKTMMSAFVLEELARAMPQGPRKVAYFFCDDKDDRRRTATAILRGLLFQFLDKGNRHLFKHAAARFKISNKDLFGNFDDLWLIFKDIICDSDFDHYYILIDALDECEQTEASKFAGRLLTLNRTLSKAVRFWVTSRPIKTVKDLCDATQYLDIETAKVKAGILEYIDLKVNELAKDKGYSIKLKEDIRTALRKRVSDTFLWVSLVIKDLAKVPYAIPQEHDGLIRQKLEALPKGLNEQYDRILRGVKRNQIDQAQFVLQLVAIAYRPLTVDELDAAYALRPRKRKEHCLPKKNEILKDVHKCFLPMVYVNKQNGTVNLVYQSAKDYLLDQAGHSAPTLKSLREFIYPTWHRVTPDRAHELTLEVCWQYRSLSVGRSPEARSVNHNAQPGPLQGGDHISFDYASKQWQQHPDRLSPSTAARFIRSHDMKQNPQDRDEWFCNAAGAGRRANCKILSLLLQQGADIEKEDTSGLRPLIRAIDIFSLNARTPLAWTAIMGHWHTAKPLLENKADASLKDVNGHTPLWYSVRNNHHGITQLLLDHGNVSDIEDASRTTWLLAAAAVGRLDIVEFLVARDGIVLNGKDEKGRTPLWLAAHCGHKEVVDLLLRTEGVDADVPKKNGMTPLITAIDNDHEEIAEVLLKTGRVNPNARCYWFDNASALMLAVYEGWKGVVELLLNTKGVDINAVDGMGRTALSVARIKGKKDIEKLLLLHGAASPHEVVPGS
ncbi:hypothetical protein QBC34DRAFT_497565 [Podospora aff. communis PSN243]|uniref:NACHT domain-containing protein n=1 Tax=Podospora aff. communis PSN243 TaxID=3040156 RepID=A0AAV9GC62_9PEZI|nr:hypothetical protein QBC34DRAFT_497565 [Podospora aff. communis PSN243]